MLRIQSKSICRSHPIFDTLAETSELADAVIARAYEIAIARRRAPRIRPAIRPISPRIRCGSSRSAAWACASSISLPTPTWCSCWRIPTPPRSRFWTRVAERLIDIVTAYTGEGVLFAVDTRLRPNGGGGPLVQTETAVRDYFARAAEAWEGITYMKSRAVAGDAARAEVVPASVCRKSTGGATGRAGVPARICGRCAMRLEKEQGASHPLKAGRGGYYDIDFMLMYLRLKSAGIFFKVLNTPARIEVLESMGHLDRAEAQFLNEAATFYRALDHGLRVLSGHAEGKLPASQTQNETLGALLPRWTPVPMDALADIRTRTRALFDRLFG